MRRRLAFVFCFKFLVLAPPKPHPHPEKDESAINNHKFGFMKPKNCLKSLTKKALSGRLFRLYRGPLIGARDKGTAEENGPRPDQDTKPSRLNTLISRLSLQGLHALERLIRNASPKIFSTVSFAGRVFARTFILPIYKLATVVRLKTGRMNFPARGIVLHLLSNRYLFHSLIVILSALTVGANIIGREANAQDVGQTSILYDMVTGGANKSAEQEAGPETYVQDSHYASPTGLIAVPDIDFDYQESESGPYASESVPGTLIAHFVSHEPEEPQGPVAERTETETYTVREGDTLGVIAQKFGVTVGTVLWANGRSATQYIRPGDTLKIPPVSGVIATVKKGDTLLGLAKTYGSDLEKIVQINKLDPEKDLAVGTELVLPGGQPPAAAPTRTTLARSKTTGVGPNAFATKPPDADTGSTPTSKLLWPTSWRVITQYYGWNHTGLDLDGDYNSPLYAAHDGVITTAAWNSGGYGLQVVVQGDGVMTRYAHASKLFVKVGDKVSRGQTIAMMGSTGRSTGTHLHLEVYINGRRVNPLSYIR